MACNDEDCCDCGGDCGDDCECEKTDIDELDELVESLVNGEDI